MIQIDMEMPENCHSCRFRDEDYSFCHATMTGLTIWYDENRQDFCPLVEIKTTDDDNFCADCDLSEIEKMNGGCQLCRAR